MKHVLTIAGSDCSGGAGIQTDLKTFAACGVYGMSIITTITAQNTLGVISVENVSKDMIENQFRAIFEDINVDAVKIGMLSDMDIIETVYDMLLAYRPQKIVLDPVMVSTSGFDLLTTSAKSLLVEKLIPLSDLITPNLSEARAILYEINKKRIDSISTKKEMVEIGLEISRYTGVNVLIKGGHLEQEACDVLIKKDGEIFYYNNERIDTRNTHGTGCTLSSAIASYISKGYEIEDAVSMAKKFITDAIKNSLDIGHGCGPTNPMGEIYKKIGI